MFVFPPALAPPAPFPVVLSGAVQSAFVAPGVQRGDYRLTTSAGPLLVHVIAIDPREPTVRFGVVLAGDRLISPGETTSSMAVRTGAVAGVNADYFDIGGTNQPLGAVVQNGVLVRTPSKRVVLEVLPDKTIRFVRFHFSGTVSYGSTSVPLTAVDEWPPQGGASFLTPSYGTLKPVAGVRVATLVPLSTSSGIDGAYRVASLGEVGASAPVRGSLLAFGPAALALAPPPNAGDNVEIRAALDPPLAEMTAAVGGGPLLVAARTPYEDPNAPAPEERDRRFPVSGAATLADGTVLLIAVDGRFPAQSVGVTRPEFAALMLGLRANDGMAFDSGGSATLVGRVLGDERASIINAPSDGFERPVADGFFVYSDAPSGRDPHLVVTPSDFRAVPGAVVPLRGAIVDDAGHRVRAANVPAVRVASQLGRHAIVVREIGGAASVTLTYLTLSAPAKLSIDPPFVNPNPGQTIRFSAAGADANGDPMYLSAVQWEASAGSIASDGTYRAGARDATIVAREGSVSAAVDVRVGRHEERLVFPPQALRFETAPRAGPGSLTYSPPAQSAGAGEYWELTYDFSGAERAAYAAGALALPGIPLAFGLEVRGDGSGTALRAAFLNRFGERRALTLARSVNWIGWRRVELALPADLNPPVTLASIYAVMLPGSKPLRLSGAIAFRNPLVTLAGTPR